MQIKVKTALAHEQQKENEAVKRELASIQEYIDNHIPDLEEESIYFIPLQGNYMQIKRTMLFAGVMISTTKKSVQGIKGTLRTQLVGYDAEVAKIQFEFPPEFLGSLDYAEGLPVHFQVPVRGLKEDAVIKSSSFQCTLEDVEVLAVNG